MALQPESKDTMHQTWSNPQWPAYQINVENALDYFSHASNPFYESTCDNERLIMAKQPLAHLTQMKGIQYALVHSCGPLFVIGKHHRQSEKAVIPICYYYIMNGNVYQCPDMYSLIQARLTQAVHPLRKAMALASKYSRFDVNKGHSWQFDVEPAKAVDALNEEAEKRAKKSVLQDPTTVRSTQYQAHRTERILQLTMKRFPLEDVNRGLEQKKD